MGASVSVKWKFGPWKLTVLLGAGYSLFVTGATMDGLSWVLPAGGLLMLVGGFVVRRLLAARRARRNPSAAQAAKGRA